MTIRILALALLLAATAGAQELTPDAATTLLLQGNVPLLLSPAVLPIDAIGPDRPEEPLRSSQSRQADLAAAVREATGGATPAEVRDRLLRVKATFPEVEDEGFLVGTARALLAQGQMDAGRRLLTATLDIFPTSITCFCAYAELYARTGKLAEALAHSQQRCEALAGSQDFTAQLLRLFHGRLEECRPYADLPLKDDATRMTYRFRLLDQELSLILDPSARRFQAEQTYVLEYEGKAPTRELPFAHHPQIVVDDLRIETTSGLLLGGQERPLRSFEETLGALQPVFVAQLRQAVAPGQRVHLKVAWHLRPEAVVEIPSIWGFLTVSPEAAYSIYPTGGHRLMFGLNERAPFRMTVTYPKSGLLCVPGERLASQEQGAFRRETYRSSRPGIPTFSWIPGRRTVRTQEGLTLEWQLFEHLRLPEPVVDQSFAALRLFHEVFGSTGTTHVRLASSGVPHATPLNRGGENKGDAIYLSEDRFRAMADDPAEVPVIFHELFHDYNLFSVDWRGPYGEWFAEGGANFVMAWAAERIQGPELGALQRRRLTEAFIRAEGFRASASLGTADKSMPYARTLIYNYGALVWEQLRQRLGDEAFFRGLGAFFKSHAGRDADMDELLGCWPPHKASEVRAWLEPWLDHNAQVALAIQKVETQQTNGGSLTEVTLDCGSDRDYEVFTSLVWRVEGDPTLHRMPVRMLHKGPTTLRIEGDAPLVFIQLDPEARVPLASLQGLLWERGH